MIGIQSGIGDSGNDVARFGVGVGEGTGCYCSFRPATAVVLEMTVAEFKYRFNTRVGNLGWRACLMHERHTLKRPHNGGSGPI